MGHGKVEVASVHVHAGALQSPQLLPDSWLYRLLLLTLKKSIYSIYSKDNLQFFWAVGLSFCRTCWPV